MMQHERNSEAQQKYNPADVERPAGSFRLHTSAEIGAAGSPRDGQGEGLTQKHERAVHEWAAQ